MKKTFSKLKKELPYGDKIAIEMKDVESFIIIPKSRVSVIGTAKNILQKFVTAYSRGTVVDQADSLSDFTDWPNQGVVVGVSQDITDVKAGDVVKLRSASGVNMKVEGRVVRIISPKDIYIIRHDS